ncbi:MAG: AAA family ATPase [Oscillospiraceae bacterium]
MKNIIHIFGASGSGTSTLVRAISEKYGHAWLDTDDYFWLPTDPPFTTKRGREERISLLTSDIKQSEKCVITGSLCGWGDILISKFELCIWIQTSTEVRIRRLESREYFRFDNRIKQDGDMYKDHTSFIEWAKTYDTADSTERSYAMHYEWKQKLNCPVLVLDGTKPVEKLLDEINLFTLYLDNPCGTLSIPYWKNKNINLPDNMKVAHDEFFDKDDLKNYLESKFFRLSYRYNDKCVARLLLDNFSVYNTDSEVLAQHINQCYDDIQVTVEQIEDYANHPVFDPYLRIAIIDNHTGEIAATGIAEIDRDCKEGILEWVQVTPKYRRKHFGEYVVCELLKRMRGKVDFVTVSGDCDNQTSPELLYRKCGFRGNDIWHILRKKEI